MNRRIVLFGACDRHNLGDLLFPHVASALLREHGVRGEIVVAGLVGRDLRAAGGHAVQPLAALLSSDTTPAVLIHAGGELLTCDAWRAAVMLLPADAVQPTVAYFEARPAARADWTARTLGSAARAPYVQSRTRWPQLERVLFNAVGGVDLEATDSALRTEVRAALRAADAVTVRDAVTQAQLAAAGIDAPLLPDPAVMVAALFGTAIRAQSGRGESATLAQAFPQGHLAVQFSAEFGDDRTLDALAAQLDRVAADTGIGLALFRAGAAPWHDDLDVYRRLLARLRTARARIVESLHVLDLCALIAASRGFAGSSLHGRIVASAFGLPRVNLRSPAAADHPGKQAAYAATWEEASMPAVVDVDALAPVLAQALTLDGEALWQQADALAHRYRTGFAALCAGLQ
jgi:hypothetical protein